ncbi:MAG: ABC transporter permease subunit [Planctomycetota bacterium]|nr:ABC transporter permease subunit [Planctomycetota bacterium]
MSNPRASPDARRRPFPITPRIAVALSILVAGALAWMVLDAPFAKLVPQEGGLRVVRAFFARALTPALDYESPVPESTPHILMQALAAARRTLVFAAAGMSVALVLGIVLGFLSTTAWWAGDLVGGSSPLRRALARTVGPAVWSASRALIVLMRSVHELLWAVLFLAAFGLNTGGAVAAIAIPYGGTLAKIFSEMVEETPRDAALALRGAGAGPLQVFFFGLVPRAGPDLAAYAFYRFECAVRSAAVLGFFGFPTLGYAIAQSFENLHYGEVWTYLYALVVLVVTIELWSGALRRRFVA